MHFVFAFGVEISEQCFIHGSGHVMYEAKLQLWLPGKCQTHFLTFSKYLFHAKRYKLWFMRERSAKS